MCSIIQKMVEKWKFYQSEQLKRIEKSNFDPFGGS